jgi:predicted PurR-regulated permease PerM
MDRAKLNGFFSFIVIGPRVLEINLSDRGFHHQTFYAERELGWRSNCFLSMRLGASLRMTRLSKYNWIWIFVGLALAVLLRDVLLIMFMAVLLGVVMSFPVGLFARAMPRGVAVLLTLFLMGSVSGAIGYLGYRPLSNQIEQLKEQAPKAREKIAAWLQKVQGSPSSSAQQAQPQTRQPPPRSPGESARSILAKGGQIAISLTSVLTMAIVILVLAAFLSHEPTAYEHGMRALIPKDWEPEFDVLWARLSKGLKRWVGGILVSMVIMGSLTAIGLGIVGIQGWALLGVLTFFGTFIPYAGAIASAIPGLILALSQSTEKFGLALIVYAIIHLIEGYIVEPLIMKRAVVIRPAILLTWQLVMTALFGVLGIIVATPLLACVQITIGYLYIERALGKVATHVGGKETSRSAEASAG